MSQMRFATVGDVTLHYSVEGARDGVPLVFINSLGTDLRIWDQVVAHFAADFFIIRYDKRGHGLSDCPPGPYTIHELATDLDSLLGHVGAGEVILVGISVGGMIALDYAIHHPRRVRALVLCDTAAKIGTAEMWNARIDAVRQNGLEAQAEAILARWFAHGFADQYPAVYRGYYNMLTRTPAVGYVATCEALRDADLRDRAGGIGARALVVCGAEDVATPPEMVRELAATLADARFEVIERAAHLPCVEQPGTFAAKMRRFFEENGYV